MIKIARIFFPVFCIFLSSCSSLLGGNTIREYNDRKYWLDVNTMEITSEKKSDLKITKLILNLVDSNTKKYKNYLLNVSFEDIPSRYNLITQTFLKDSITKNYSKIILETDKYKTWYSVDISPRDWQSGKNIYFIKNEW